MNYENGNINQEIVPLIVKGEKFEDDESIKPNLNLKTLSRFKPQLPNGTVTVGNSCMKNDGAVLVLIMELETAKYYGFNNGLYFKGAMTKV